MSIKAHLENLSSGGDEEADMTWIRTYTGREFDLRDPDPKDVDVIDIAHHLSNICRFTGATREFYSVAQHCVIVSTFLPVHVRLHGLLHDAGEAYLNDVTTPLKRMLPPYDDLERNVLVAVYRALKLQYPSPQEAMQVRRADVIALATEIRDLGGGDPDRYGLGVDPMTNEIVPLSPPEAEQLWMERFLELYDESKL